MNFNHCTYIIYTYIKTLNNVKRTLKYLKWYVGRYVLIYNVYTLYKFLQFTVYTTYQAVLYNILLKSIHAQIQIQFFQVFKYKYRYISKLFIYVLNTFFLSQPSYKLYNMSNLLVH